MKPKKSKKIGNEKNSNNNFSNTTIQGNGTNTILQNSICENVIINSPYYCKGIIKFEIDKKSIKIYSKNSLEKNALFVFLKILISLLGIIFSNSIITSLYFKSILEKVLHFTYFSLYMISTFLFIISALLFLIFLCKKSMWIYLEGRKLLLGEKKEIKRLKIRGDEEHVFVARDEFGNYIIFSYKVNCSYLSCKGEVRLFDPPINERANHCRIGICLVDNKKHTYEVDNNLIAYPKPFNWNIFKKQENPIVVLFTKIILIFIKRFQ